MCLKVSVVLWSHNVKVHLNDESSIMESKEMSPLECKQSQVSQSPFPKTEINTAIQRCVFHDMELLAELLDKSGLIITYIYVTASSTKFGV